MQLPPSPSELLRELRNRPPGTLVPRFIPEPLPETYTRTKECIKPVQFCSVWLRGVIVMTFFQGYRQPVMRNCKLAGILAVCQLILGIILTIIAYHIGISSTSLNVRDVPVWAGIPLTITGLYGTLFICCCHKDYPGTYGIFLMKAVSFGLSSLSLLLCLCSTVFAALHLEAMSSYTECVSARNADDCVCQLTMPSRKRLFLYDGLQCENVFTILWFFFVLVCVTGSLGAIVTFVFAVLLWGSRYESIATGLNSNDEGISALTNV